MAGPLAVLVLALSVYTCSSKSTGSYISLGPIEVFANGNNGDRIASDSFQHEMQALVPAVYPISCYHWRAQDGKLTPGATYRIDPDGPGGEEPFKVKCRVMDGTTWTSITHNRARIHKVGPIAAAEAPFSLRMPINYTASMQQLRGLVSVSQTCRMYVKQQCHHIVGNRTGWVGFHGLLHTFDVGGDVCDVHPETGKRLCDCDLNQGLWAGDAGYITKYDQFPITAFALGDLGSKIEKTKLTVGPMECAGNGNLTP